MGIASSTACMQCHSAIKTDSPAIQKLATFAERHRELKWARVYEIPSNVTFSHKLHLDAQVACQDCHGPVAERDQLFREGNITMGGCMRCHQAKKASIDCGSCHEDRR